MATNDQRLLNMTDNKLERIAHITDLKNERFAIHAVYSKELHEETLTICTGQCRKRIKIHLSTLSESLVTRLSLLKSYILQA